MFRRALMERPSPEQMPDIERPRTLRYNCLAHATFRSQSAKPQGEALYALTHCLGTGRHAFIAALVGKPVMGQLIDRTIAPNAANEGIAKSLEDQIGAGRGTPDTPNSSLYIINRDPARAIRRGRQIFQRKFTRVQGQRPVTGDGAGNPQVDRIIGAGLMDSCAGCHGRPRGSAGFGGLVVTRLDSRDAPHLFGLGLKEMLADQITDDPRDIRDDAINDADRDNRTVTRSLRVSVGNTTLSFGFIRAFPNRTVDTSGVEGVNADLRIRPFFLHGETMSIREFVVGAFNAEMGLEAPEPDFLSARAGNRVTTPSGMVLDGRRDQIEAPPVTSPTHDFDGDGKVNEIPTSIVDFMEFYLLHYFKPATGRQTSTTSTGRSVMAQIGCTSCHVPDMVIRRDRRLADVETVYDPSRGNPFNPLFATANLLLQAVPNSGNPPLVRPVRGSFTVRNIFTDFKDTTLARISMSASTTGRCFNGCGFRRTSKPSLRNSPVLDVELEGAEANE
jgi:hypothetical protein